MGALGTNPGESGGLDVTLSLRLTWDGSGAIYISAEGDMSPARVKRTLESQIANGAERLELLRHALRLVERQYRV